jgi:hypothetical protein
MTALTHDTGDLETQRFGANAPKGDVNFLEEPFSPGGGRSSVRDHLSSRQRHVSRSESSGPIDILVPYTFGGCAFDRDPRR